MFDGSAIVFVDSRNIGRQSGGGTVGHLTAREQPELAIAAITTLPWPSHLARLIDEFHSGSLGIAW